LGVIVAILFFGSILVFVVVTFRIGDKPSIYETFQENRKKAGAISSDELNSLPEMKMLQASGLPQSAIDAFIFHPDYDLYSDIYPATLRNVVIIKIGDAEHDIYNDTFSSTDYVVTHIPVDGEDTPKVSMYKEHLLHVDYEVVAEIYFFDLIPENIHQIYNIGSLEVHGQYMIPAPGVNTYTVTPFTMKRDNIKIVVVSSEEMAALKELRKLCSEVYCEAN